MTASAAAAAVSGGAGAAGAGGQGGGTTQGQAQGQGAQQQGQSGAQGAPSGQQQQGQGSAQGVQQDASQQAQRPEWVPEKFWKDGKVDAEGLAKSHQYLETQLGEANQKLGDLKKAEKPDGKEKGDGKPKPGSTKTEAQAEAKVGSALFEAAKQDFAANEGKFSPEMQQKLIAAGFSAQELPQIQTMLHGEYAAIYEEANKTIFEGKLDEVVEWQKQGLSERNAAALNALFLNPETRMLGLLALKAAWSHANGGGPAIGELGDIGGHQGGDLFPDEAAYNRAQADKRYGVDKQYTLEVDKRMERSVPHWK